MLVHSKPINNHNFNFNPIDKIVELYEALLKSEKEKVEMLQKMIPGKSH